MKKIGVLLDSLQADRYLYATVRQLAESGRVELFFLLNENGPVEPGFWNRALFTIKTQGLLRFIDLSFFRFWTRTEYAILAPFSGKIREHFRSHDLKVMDPHTVIRMHPVFSASGFTARYPREDIDKIKNLGLDLIIRGNAPGIFKGDILKAAGDGIISFHHGDNRWNRGGPPGFWEVYLRRPSTGFVIQILTEELDGGKVLLRADIPTLQSYTENLVNLYHESNPYLAGVVLDHAADGRLPPAEKKSPFSGSVFRIPTFFQSCVYLWRTFWVYVVFVVRQYVLNRGPRWSVAFVRSPWRQAVLGRGTEIKNPPGRNFADPFVVTRDNRTVCFVEDCSRRTKKGRVTAVEITGRTKYHILGPVLEEPFHVSFPYIFEYQGGLYMVPETREAQAIRIYQCVDFPMKWTHLKDIMSRVNAVDSMIFRFRDKWWLLTNLGTPGNTEYFSTLMAFYSDHPFSDKWTPHKMNPLVFDCARARNGGLLDAAGASPVRVRQRHGFKVYGASLSLAEIIELTPSVFREEETGQIHPGFFRRIRAVHHLHSDGPYTVYDYAR